MLESSSARGGVDFKEKIKMPLISGEDVLGRQETCLEQGKIGCVYYKKKFVSIVPEERLSAFYSPCRN